MNNLSMLKDKDDFVKELTKDDIINVVGTKGSGKTTLSLKYIDDDDYIVINTDKLFGLPSNDKQDKELDTIRKMLIDKYKVIPNGEEFYKTYNDIIDYVKTKNKKVLIEGNSIIEMDPKYIKGTIIIKRTAVLKSFKRAVKRDYNNEYFMNLEKEKHKYIYKNTRLCKITKRRKSVFKDSKEINKIIDKYDK